MSFFEIQEKVYPEKQVNTLIVFIVFLFYYFYAIENIFNRNKFIIDESAEKRYKGISVE